MREDCLLVPKPVRERGVFRETKKGRVGKERGKGGSWGRVVLRGEGTRKLGKKKGARLGKGEDNDHRS